MKENKRLFDEIQSLKAKTPVEKVIRETLSICYDRSLMFEKSSNLILTFVYASLKGLDDNLLALEHAIDSLSETRIGIPTENADVLWALVYRGWRVTRAYEDELTDWPGKVKIIEVVRG